MKTRITGIALGTIVLVGFSNFTQALETPSNSPGVISRVEVVSHRNANTRIWQSTKVVNDYDPITQTVSQITVTSNIYEKGDGLNYNAGTDTTPNWQPTVGSIQSLLDPTYQYQALQGHYQVKFARDLNANYPISYTVNGRTLHLGLRYLAFYDKSNGTLQPFSYTNLHSPTLQGNKVTYPDAFSGIDVRYVYTKGAFQQNIIVKYANILPQPTQYQMNPDSAYLVSVTEIDDSQFPYVVKDYQGNTLQADSILSGEGKDFYFMDTTKRKIIYQFAQSEAFDSQSQTHPLAMYKHIVRQGEHTYLVEGVPYSWLQSAQYPVTLDYELRTGGQSDNEVWKSGNTYYITGDYSINNGYTLVIEGGTVCKYSTGRRITVNSGGTIIAKGDKFNYVLFTSAKDSSIGEIVLAGTPAASDYSYAINISYLASSSRIEYCKIGYANIAIGVYGGPASASLSIQNNILRTGATGIDIEAYPTVNIQNNLISLMNNYGLYMTDNGNKAQYQGNPPCIT